VVVFSAGVEDLLPWATLAVQVLWLWLVWNLFATHARPWTPAGPPDRRRAGEAPDTQ
jgi:hypothetical protein